MNFCLFIKIVIIGMESEPLPAHSNRMLELGAFLPGPGGQLADPLQEAPRALRTSTCWSISRAGRP